MEIIMYISAGLACPDNALFMMPHLENPIKAKRITRKYPDFAKEFDGSTPENLLTWYYKYNKSEGVFEFKDPEAEEEVAELLGVKLFVGEYVNEDSTGSSATKLTDEDVSEVRAYIADIRNGLKVMEEKGK